MQEAKASKYLMEHVHHTPPDGTANFEHRHLIG
jgi:hypothetical protein